VGRVVGIAGGRRKIAAIGGALAGKWINVLITDRMSAEQLLADRASCERDDTVESGTKAMRVACTFVFLAALPAVFRGQCVLLRARGRVRRRNGSTRGGSWTALGSKAVAGHRARGSGSCRGTGDGQMKAGTAVAVKGTARVLKVNMGHPPVRYCWTCYPAMEGGTRYCRLARSAGLVAAGCHHGDFVQSVCQPDRLRQCQQRVEPAGGAGPSTCRGTGQGGGPECPVHRNVYSDAGSNAGNGAGKLHWIGERK